jgi:hypothetical protein
VFFQGVNLYLNGLRISSLNHFVQSHFELDFALRTAAGSANYLVVGPTGIARRTSYASRSALDYIVSG